MARMKQGIKIGEVPPQANIAKQGGSLNPGPSKEEREPDNHAPETEGPAKNEHGSFKPATYTVVVSTGGSIKRTDR